jgi:hypothetical protein
MSDTVIPRGYCRHAKESHEAEIDRCPMCAALRTAPCSRYVVGMRKQGSLSPEHILRANEALKMAQSAAKAVEFVTGSEDSAVRVSIGVVLASLSDLAAILAEMGAK